MALNIKISDPWKVLGQFGIGASTIKKLKTRGIDVAVSQTSIRFSYQGTVVSKQDLYEGVLGALTSGNLGPASLHDLAGQLSGAIKKAIANAKTLADAEPLAGVTNSPAQATAADALAPDLAAEMDKIFETEPALEKIYESADLKVTMTDGGPVSSAKANKAAADMAAAMGTVTAKSSLLDATPVKLRDAEEVYQPVTATSAGSRYFVVGLSATVSVAARFKGTTLSLRAEGRGKGLAQEQAKLFETCGFTYNKGKGYASVHVQCGDAELARKALAALVYSVPVGWTHAPVDLDIFAGKGA